MTRMADFKPLEFIAPLPVPKADVKGIVRADGARALGLSIGLSDAVLDRLQWPHGTVLAPTLAENELKLQPLAGAAIRVQFPKKGGARFRLPRFVRLVWKDQARRALRYRTDGKSLIVTLPAEWLVAGPLR